MPNTKYIHGVLLFFFTLIIMVSCQSNNNKAKEEMPYVVMLSLDGFRWDYTEMAETPSLDSIAANGVKAAYLVPCFPTKTFPNHYSIVTGL